MLIPVSLYGRVDRGHRENIPVVNAGDGTHEHPSQGLLDALTIRDRLGQIQKHPLKKLASGIGYFKVHFGGGQGNTGVAGVGGGGGGAAITVMRVVQVALPPGPVANMV